MTNQNERDKSAVLAEFICQTKSQDVPAQIRQKAVRHILDSIGAGIAGAVSKEVELLIKTLKDLGEPQGVSIAWARGETMTPLHAALVNGAGSHSFELDDTGGCDHSGAVVIPAAIAALEIAHQRRIKVTGEEFVTAVILGYDIARRALESCGAYAPHNKAGFHSTGTCGTFGAATVAARILGLDVHQTQMALGLAGSFSAGLWACVHDGAQSKRLHAGHAAMGGLMSACLAQNGFTGPTKIFEEVWGGFNHTYAFEGNTPEAWLSELGENWKIKRVSIKPHASCRSTHSSIDAVDILRKKMGFEANDIEAINITINPFVYGMCGAFANHPMPAAQLSIPYSVAADLVFGNASLPSFERSKRDDPRVLSLMERIHFTIDKTQADLEEPLVEVVLKDGRKDSEKVNVPLGAPDNPVTDEALLTKFISVSTLALDEKTVKTLAQHLLALDDEEDAYQVIVPYLSVKPEKIQLFNV